MEVGEGDAGQEGEEGEPRKRAPRRRRAYRGGYRQTNYEGGEHEEGGEGYAGPPPNHEGEGDGTEPENQRGKISLHTTILHSLTPLDYIPKSTNARVNS